MSFYACFLERKGERVERGRERILSWLYAQRELDMGLDLTTLRAQPPEPPRCPFLEDLLSYMYIFFLFFSNFSAC